MSTLLDAARRYSAAGLSVVPLKGKRTTIGWGEYQSRGASDAMLQYWDQTGLLQNIGIVCGEVSGNLVVIDCDGLDAVEWFKEKFPHLLETFTVTTGSGRGAHFYYRPTILPDTVRAVGVSVGNVEFRANGCYVVAPPSIHPDTRKPYTVATSAKIMRLNSIRPVYEAIRDLKPSMSVSAASNPGEVRHVSNYAAAALANARGAIIAAKAVNNMINLQAFKMGKLVAAGMVDRATVEQALYAAAFDAGYVARDGERQTRATINSGLNAGLNNGANR